MKNKDYNKWHRVKERVNGSDKRPFFHAREIWFCNVGENVGYEQDGTGEEFLRPVLIFRKFNNEIFWAIPLTRSHHKVNKNNDQFYYTFSFEEGVISVAILSQIKLMDAKRLDWYVGRISEVDMSKLKEKLKRLCD